MLKILYYTLRTHDITNELDVNLKILSCGLAFTVSENTIQAAKRGELLSSPTKLQHLWTKAITSM